MNPKINLAIGVINLLVATFLAYAFFFSQEKVVYVNSAKLLNEYQGMIDARAAFQQKATAWKANVDTLTDEVKQAIVNYEKESSKMTAKERQLSQDLIRSKQSQLAQYQQSLNAQAQQEDQKMTNDILVKVNAFLETYGSSKGYRIILAANEYGSIAYAEKDLDITAEVLTGLNKDYAGK